MSALRVRYETMQLKKRYETRDSAEQTEHLLTLTQDAFQDWAHAYPKDPWLASNRVCDRINSMPSCPGRQRTAER